MPDIRPLTEAERLDLQQTARALGLFVNTELVPELARAAAYWLKAPAELREKASPEFKASMEASLADLARLGDLYRKIQAGQAVLVLYEVPGDPVPVQGIGFMDRNQVPAPPIAGLGALPAILGIVTSMVVLKYATLAAVAAGAWLLLDAGIEGYKMKNEAEKLRAETAVEYARIVAEEYRRNPEAGKKYAEYAVAAGRSSIEAGANPQGLLQQLTGAAGAVAGGIGGLLMLWIGAKIFGDIAAGTTKRSKARA